LQGGERVTALNVNAATVMKSNYISIALGVNRLLVTASAVQMNTLPIAMIVGIS
jgi:hypothetical protein